MDETEDSIDIKVNYKRKDDYSREYPKVCVNLQTDVR